ncbi:hypothetical protein TNCV_425621 [Trichonephila clavipes]|nr:hypothetical protein TNCV_425621 [Trichonephila clavipes]
MRLAFIKKVANYKVDSSRPSRMINFWSTIIRATRGLLTTVRVILNPSQVTRTTPQMAPPSPNFPTTPIGGHLSLVIFNVHRPPQLDGSSAVLDSNS